MPGIQRRASMGMMNRVHRTIMLRLRAQSQRRLNLVVPASPSAKRRRSSLAVAGLYPSHSLANSDQLVRLRCIFGRCPFSFVVSSELVLAAALVTLVPPARGMKPSLLLTRGPGGFCPMVGTWVADAERDGGCELLNVSFKGIVVKSTERRGGGRCLARSGAEADALGGDDDPD